MPEPNLLAGGHAKADAPVPPVVLHQDVPEGDAAQERPGRAVVKHAQAVRAGLPRVHKQIVQGPRLQPHILRHKLASGMHHTHPPIANRLLLPASCLDLLLDGRSPSRWKMTTRKHDNLQIGKALR